MRDAGGAIARFDCQGLPRGPAGGGGGGGQRRTCTSDVGACRLAGVTAHVLYINCNKPQHDQEPHRARALAIGTLPCS